MAYIKYDRTTNLSELLVRIVNCYISLMISPKLAFFLFGMMYSEENLNILIYCKVNII